MRFAILSDIHANLVALEKVLADAQSAGVEKIVCLGDVVGYGPEPGACVDRLRAECALVVAGNHDDAVSGRRTADDFIGLAADAVYRHRAALSSEQLAWLHALPYATYVQEAFAVHGDYTAPEEFRYVEDAEDARVEFETADARMLFVGHTHVPAVYVRGADGKVRAAAAESFAIAPDCRYLVNPGAVGYPREANGTCLSSYVIYDTDAQAVTFRYLPFSVASVMQRGTGSVKRRRGLVALAIGAVAALALGFGLAFGRRAAPTPVAGPAPVKTVLAEPKPVEVRELFLSSADRIVRANLKLNTGSTHAILRHTFYDAKGKTVEGPTQQTVKKSSAGAIPVPKGAVCVEFKVFAQNPSESPKIKDFKPTTER